LSRKMKHDASRTLGERTKKQCETPRVLHVGYRKHMQQLFSEMSHTHRGFFGFVTPPSLRRTPAFTDKKFYNYLERGHLTCQYLLTLNYHRHSTLTMSS
jgi:hypothetical protein